MKFLEFLTFRESDIIKYMYEHMVNNTTVKYKK
jgi:hypothetical protein